jgi:hypothetical protein
MKLQEARSACPDLARNVAHSAREYTSALRLDARRESAERNRDVQRSQRGAVFPFDPGCHCMDGW